MNTSTVTPLERVRKVYKDKINSFEKTSYSHFNKMKVEEEKKDNQSVENGTSSVSADELRAKRDAKYTTAFMGSFVGNYSKILNEHQYRVRLSKTSMEVDNM